MKKKKTQIPKQSHVSEEKKERKLPSRIGKLNYRTVCVCVFWFVLGFSEMKPHADWFWPKPLSCANLTVSTINSQNCSHFRQSISFPTLRKNGNHQKITVINCILMLFYLEFFHFFLLFVREKNLKKNLVANTTWNPLSICKMNSHHHRNCMLRWTK